MAGSARVLRVFWLGVLATAMFTILVEADFKNGNSGDYADPYCLKRLEYEIDQAISAMVSKYLIENSKDISENVGRRAGRRARNEVNKVEERLPIKDGITRAITRTLRDSFATIGESSIGVTTAVLQKLCVEERCCYL